MKISERVIPFGKPLIGDEEKKAVLDVLSGTTLVHGPKAKEFEAVFADFTGAPYAVSVSSCTAGLHLLYFYLGLKAGDEVIVPAETHVATAHAVELAGGKPIFVDAEIRTGNIDIEQIESKITSKTRALSLVHFLGMPVDMKKIESIAQKYNLFVVEDCALAVGSYYEGVHCGLLGDAGCFSFYPVKHLTTAEGGMLITKHENVARKIEKQKAFGVDRHVGERSMPGIYDVPELGFNYRMNEIEAVIGIEQVRKVEGFLNQRRKNYEVLYAKFREMPEIKIFKSTEGIFQSSYYAFSIILKSPLISKRPEIVQKLKAEGIGTSVYYPQPVPLMTYYKNKYQLQEKEFPVAMEISHGTIAFPVGPHLNEEDMHYIAQRFKQILSEIKV